MSATSAESISTQTSRKINARAAGIVAGANPDDATVDPNFRSETGRVPR